jgi:hypothetical protein
VPDFLKIERPPPQPPAVRRLRALVAVCALTTVVVDLLNLGYAEEGGFGLGVRTVWALLRAVGFLVLMRTIRYGRLVSRPFALILSVTTVFAVGRLLVPRHGRLVPDWPVLVAFGVLGALCGAVLWQLYRSPVIGAHLTRRPPRRAVPPWVLTCRVAGLSYSALLMVPALVALGSLFGEHRVRLAVAAPVVAGWLAGAVALGFATPWVMIFVILGKRWARGLLAAISVGVLLAGPALCRWLLGADGLVRDGIPLAVAALACLSGLWASRHSPAPVRRPAAGGAFAGPGCC